MGGFADHPGLTTQQSEQQARPSRALLAGIWRTEAGGDSPDPHAE